MPTQRKTVQEQQKPTTRPTLPTSAPLRTEPTKEPQKGGSYAAGGKVLEAPPPEPVNERVEEA